MASTPALPAVTVGAALRSGDRWVAALLLLVMSGTHLVLVPDHLKEAPYAGVLFLLLALAGLALAGLMVLRDSALVWAAAAVVAGATIVAFVLSRTVGLPELGDDVGNWTEPLSFPALAAQAMMVGLAVNTWLTRRSAHAERSGQSTRSVEVNSAE